MKTLKCDVEGCDYEISGEDFQSWLNVCFEHWKSNHADKMANGTKEEGEKWMAEAKKRFKDA